ncbi:hypothetical protein [Micromonospora sp. RTGN7]|uniref:hypothetical protein n=1 Tax=Micromonospora sp. RTGN7 TaxID=3016526 RepID=UPI0029FF4ADE|nr:hypothetical protein [Micromonospora sp. RTGN7]
MAVTAYPMNASGGAPAFTARQGRQALAALTMAGAGALRTRSGFRPGGAPAVSVDATTWSVGPWSGVINANATGVQGPYLAASDGTDTGPMTAADGTYARRDILYVQVDDTDEDASGQRRGRVLYLAGTAAAAPSAPATPARSVLIGLVDVPKVGSGNPTFTASRLWTVAAGGIVPVGSAAERNGLTPYDGLVVERGDVGGDLEVYAGGWRPVQGDAVLSELWYGQGQTYVVRSNATNARADIDAALTLTFTAPDTGRVWIELEGMAASTGVPASTGVFGTYWCLKDNNGGGLVPNSSVAMLPTGDTQATRLRYSARITGLTAGQSYTYIWQHFRGAGSGTAWFYIGGGSIYSLMRARRAT